MRYEYEWSLFVMNHTIRIFIKTESLFALESNGNFQLTIHTHRNKHTVHDFSTNSKDIKRHLVHNYAAFQEQEDFLL